MLTPRSWATWARLRDLENATAEDMGKAERAKLILYGAQILGKLIEGTDIEDRLRELERDRER